MTADSSSDERYMRRALELASRGLYTCSPNPAVGCVLVRDGQIVGEGYHRRAGDWHAEVNALRMAGSKARGATCYVSLEPCSHYGRTPPCAKALVEAGVRRVVTATEDPDPRVSGRGLKLLSDAGVEVICGVLREQAEYLNRAFFKAVSTGLPYVTMKIAMSLDAKIALSDGTSAYITSVQSRRLGQKLRSLSDAVITGSGTVLKDNPRYDVRRDELPDDVLQILGDDAPRQPLKVVLDGRKRLNPEKFRFFASGQVLWCTSDGEHGAGTGASTGDGGSADAAVAAGRDNLGGSSCRNVSSASPKEPAEVHGVGGNVGASTIARASKAASGLRVRKISERLTCLEVQDDTSGFLSFENVLRYLGQQGIRRVLVEAGAKLTASIFEKFADELYVFMAPKVLGCGARDAFTLPQTADLNAEPAYRLVRAQALTGGDALLHYLRRGSQGYSAAGYAVHAGDTLFPAESVTSADGDDTEADGTVSLCCGEL